MNLKQWCVLSVLACTLSGAGVTSAAELSVNGHIRTVGACSMALGNGGVFDLGNLTRKDMKPSSGWEYNYIFREIPWTISCQRPTKVGFKVTDNRADTRPHGKTHDSSFGLGNPAIGYYNIFNGSDEADGRRADTIYALGGGWDGGRDGYSFSSGFIFSWAVPGAQKKEPLAFKTLTSKLGVNFFFRKDITFTDELKIDGSMTMELVYL